MPGEKNLDRLLKTMQPKYNAGQYVFCTLADAGIIPPGDVLMLFIEAEGATVIIKKELADSLHLAYTFTASWITLTVHSSLDAVGLTAAFSAALTAAGISCNVVAAFYHDHIFVDVKDTDKAMEVLNRFGA
jgi:uncharacterized protein